MADTIFANIPAVVLPKQPISFADAGFTVENTKIIYRVSNPLRSFKPGRGLNPVTSFEPGFGYFVILKQSGDFSGYTYPPLRFNLQYLNLVADGNSYVHGDNAQMAGAYTPFPELIAQSEPFQVRNTTVLNFGVGGQTTPQMLTDQTSQVLSKYNANKPSILLVVEGGNDIYYNSNVQQAVTNMINYCANARAVGFRVLTSTLIKRDQASGTDTALQYNNKLAAYNTLLLSSASSFDGIIRPDLEPIFQSFTAGGYDVDRIHPNQVGQQKIADLFAALIENLPS